MTLRRQTPKTAKVDREVFQHLPPADPQEVSQWEGKDYLYTILTLPDPEGIYTTFHARFNQETQLYRFNLVKHDVRRSS